MTVSDIFYRIDRIDPSKANKPEEEEVFEEGMTAEDKLIHSFMNQDTQGDDIEIIKHMWAFNMPCVLLINGGQAYWDTCIQPIYKMIYQDELI